MKSRLMSHQPAQPQVGPHFQLQVPVTESAKLQKVGSGGSLEARVMPTLNSFTVSDFFVDPYTTTVKNNKKRDCWSMVSAWILNLPGFFSMSPVWMFRGLRCLLEREVCFISISPWSVTVHNWWTSSYTSWDVIPSCCHAMVKHNGFHCQWSVTKAFVDLFSNEGFQYTVALFSNPCRFTLQLPKSVYFSENLEPCHNKNTQGVPSQHDAPPQFPWWKHVKYGQYLCKATRPEGICYRSYRWFWKASTDEVKEPEEPVSVVLVAPASAEHLRRTWHS